MSEDSPETNARIKINNNTNNILIFTKDKSVYLTSKKYKKEEQMW